MQLSGTLHVNKNKRARVRLCAGVFQKINNYMWLFMLYVSAYLYHSLMTFRQF